MSRRQNAEVWWRPPLWLIPWITRAQVWIYEKTAGRVGARAANMPHLILRGRRRRAGTDFAVCLPYWFDQRGQRILAASFGGAVKNPAWFHNVRDKSANPRVTIRDGARVFRASVEILDSPEYERVWDALVADRPFYGRYQDKTSRRIPLLRLVEADEPASATEAT